MRQSKRTPKEVRGAILGTLIGDSWISEGNRYGCQQVVESLIRLKADIISHYTTSTVTVNTRNPRESCLIGGRIIVGKTSYTIRARHPRFERWSKVLYRTGTKQVTFNILKMLSAEGLALWIMDDGYMDYKKSSRTRNLRICTDSFDSLSISSISRYFKEVWNIDTKVYYHSSLKGSNKVPRISFNARNTQKLISIIHQYILDEYLYKIDMHYLPETVCSERCSDQYREAYKIISQRKVAIIDVAKDIV